MIGYNIEHQQRTIEPSLFQLKFNKK